MLSGIKLAFFIIFLTVGRVKGMPFSIKDGNTPCMSQSQNSLSVPANTRWKEFHKTLSERIHSEINIYFFHLFSLRLDLSLIIMTEDVINVRSTFVRTICSTQTWEHTGKKANHKLIISFTNHYSSESLFLWIASLFFFFFFSEVKERKEKSTLFCSLLCIFLFSCSYIYYFSFPRVCWRSKPVFGSSSLHKST